MNTDLGKTFGDILGITENDLPTLRILRFGNGNFAKFKYEGDYAPESIEDFIDAFLNGEISDYLKSEEPYDNTGKKVINLIR